MGLILIQGKLVKFALIEILFGLFIFIMVALTRDIRVLIIGGLAYVWFGFVMIMGDNEKQ